MEKPLAQELCVELICPCCDKQCDSIKGTPLFAVPFAIAPWYYMQTPGWAILSAQSTNPNNRVQWACNACLEAKRAFPANPSAQRYGDSPVYLAYFDKICHCEDCGEAFVFEASEQQYWYEQLKFWVQSHPKQCKPCRHRRRAKKEAARHLSRASAQLDPQDVEQLLSMASCFLTVGSSAKAKEFVRRARNRAREQGILHKVQHRIDMLLNQIQ